MAEQKTLYEDYWLPMERVLGNLSFDAFLHDWMVVTSKKPVLKGRVMYAEFKRFAADSSMPRMERTHNLLENMLEYAGYYAIIEYLTRWGPGLLRLGAIMSFGGYCVSRPGLLRLGAVVG